MIRNFGLTFILLLSTQIYAGDLLNYRKIIINSLASFETSGRKDWAYTVRREQGQGDKKVVSLETFDPSKPLDTRWQLLKEYGKPPSENRIAEYLDQKKAEQTAELQSGVQKLIDMLDQDSLKVHLRQGDLVSLSFNPKITNMDPVNLAKLTGLVVIDIRKRYVVSMKISNIAQLTPEPQVILDYFSMAFSFIVTDKILLPQSIRINVSGKIGSSRKINQHSVTNYSKYRNITIDH